MSPKASTTRLPSQQQGIGRLFQRAARAHADRILESLGERGHRLTLFHTALITNLDRAGTRISVLAARAGMTKQAMGQLARELEERGYVRREPDPNDNRAALIRFTARGGRLLVDASGAKDAVEAEYAGVLGARDLARLRALLEKLVEADPRRGLSTRGSGRRVPR